MQNGLADLTGFMYTPNLVSVLGRLNYRLTNESRTYVEFFRET